MSHNITTFLCLPFLLFLGADNQAEIVEESIKHAKEAIMLDVKDGNSWCKAFYQISFG